MVFDTTTSTSKFNEELKKLYYNNALLLRKDFCKWIDEIGLKNNLDWWISNPASRNYNHSNLFHVFCLIETLKQAQPILNMSEIIVENQIIKDILINQLKIKSNVKLKKKKYFAIIKNFLLIAKHYLFYSIIFIFSKLGKEKKISNKLNLVLIDTFLEDSNLSNNRFYSNNFLNIAFKRKNIFFVPSFYLGMGLLQTIKKIINCKKNNNFLLKESFLGIKDLLKSLFLTFRRKKLNASFSSLKNIDYSSLLNKELNSNINLSSQILGWQNYLFFKNIKQQNFKIKKSINWFENQSQDKGWNLGVRTFFPKAKSYGYQGFTCFPQYMCLSPTQLEYSAKVIPEEILSIGKMFNNTKKEFCKSLKVKTAPALNFQYLYKKKNKRTKQPNEILLILSGFLQDDINIINWVINSGIHKEVKEIYIKEHPILKIDKIKKYLKYLPKNFIVTKKNFWNSVETSKYLICSGATSAITELVVSGRQCIIPRLNPHDGEILKRINISHNYVVLDNPLKLRYFLIEQKIVKYNKELYFTKLTKKNIKLFL